MRAMKFNSRCVTALIFPGHTPTRSKKTTNAARPSMPFGELHAHTVAQSFA